jgi:hypothetical protein
MRFDIALTVALPHALHFHAPAVAAVAGSTSSAAGAALLTSVPDAAAVTAPLFTPASSNPAAAVLPPHTTASAAATGAAAVAASPLVDASSPLYPRQATMNCWSAAARRCYSLATRALGDRSYLVSVAPAWRGVTCAGLTVRLLLRPDAHSRLAELGPSADDKAKAAEFRSFWGPKAELRRFPDGTILEAVSWAPSTATAAAKGVAQQQHQDVPSQIVSHVLRRHLLPYDTTRAPTTQAALTAAAAGPTPAGVSIALPTHPLESFLRPLAGPLIGAAAGLSAVPAPASGADAAVLAGKASSAFKELDRLLRSLPELPLAVISVQDTHPALRGTAVFPPAPEHRLASAGSNDSAVALATNASALSRTILEPLTVVVALETSGRWPDALVPLIRTKTAFLLKIGQLLTDKHGLATSVTTHYVDCHYSGFCFRLRLHNTKELQLLRSEAAAGRPLPPLVAADGTAREQDLELARRPLHSALMRGLVAQHASLAPVARLLRRWVCAHGFARTLSPEATELVAASVFVNPRPYTAPVTVAAGLVRALHRIATHDWDSLPLIVPKTLRVEADRAESVFKQEKLDASVRALRFETDITPEATAQIYSRFEARRRDGTAAAMFIATSTDTESRVWTMAAGPAPAPVSASAIARAQTAIAAATAAAENAAADIRGTSGASASSRTAAAASAAAAEAAAGLTAALTAAAAAGQCAAWADAGEVTATTPALSPALAMASARSSTKLVSWPPQRDLGRLVAFAAASLAGAQALLRAGEGAHAQWLELFKSPLEQYDALITLDAARALPRAAAAARARQALFPLAKTAAGAARASVDAAAAAAAAAADAAAAAAASAGKKSNGYKLPVDLQRALDKRAKLQAQGLDADSVSADPSVGVDNSGKALHAGFDPVACYVNDLRMVFGGLASFSYDPCGGDVIGVTLHRHQPAPGTAAAAAAAAAADAVHTAAGARAADPEAAGPFNAATAVASAPVPEAGNKSDITSLTKLNKKDLLDQFAALGHGLVDAVYDGYEAFAENVVY